MLIEISIKNLAVIESVRVTFHRGFHVLTGETGAGKSIIIDALSLIVGGRGSSDLVRYGCDKAEIEAMFELSGEHPVWETLQAQGIEADASEHLIIRREVTSQGKSTSRVNGQLVNLTMLRLIGEELVNIHGQHEHQSLLKAEQHLQWLDLYGEESIAAAKHKYQTAYIQYSGTLKELHHLQETSKQALQMMDLYRFQMEEIAAAELKAGEDEWLAEEKRKLANAEKMAQSVTDSYDLLNGANRGLDSVRKAISKLEEITSYDPKALQPLLEQIQSAYFQLEDASYQLRDYSDEVEFNPARIDEIEQRLDLLASFRRKYGDNVEEILAYHTKISEEIELVENKDERIQQLEAVAERQLKEVIALAEALSTLRKQAADELAAKIEAELKDLQMGKTVLRVQLQRIPDPKGWEVGGQRLRFTREGLDTAEFMISPNPGEPLKSLSKIASGGEMSRIMLAMKSIFAKVDRIPVLVFDEVDTGVSGRAAQAIAEKMSALSASCQVFSITHLPQVACMADQHYEIRKEVDGGRTSTQVEHLDHTGRVEELARMLGGVEVTDTTLHHADEMISMANLKKTSGL
ncbi:DNA recombination protein RecN [Paenibacillus swuensis]|uniref:DNA repair protein RecN n=1 Tax=Paenibacillus swuensis TaxID=1178515 RepID=A0A172TM02_9BACL|nr:DNA repair protein RecN [Paenibacillus swuensis]ANE48060.1 DNA recombination protein RecN [Paenibacillus swuensis]